MVLLEQVGFWKTFPEVPMVFRVSSSNPESLLSTPLGLGMLVGWLGTWVDPELLTVSGSFTSLASVKEFTLFCKS